jgi:hypothetical protein
LALTVPQGYSLETPPAEKPFEIGVPLEWEVRAPNAPTLPRNLTVQITGIPDDENTNDAASVTNGTVNIPVQTGESPVTVDNISADIGIGTNVAPRGAPDVRMLAIELSNPAPAAGTVTTEAIDIALLDKNGQLVADPGATISELYAVLGNQRVDAASLAQNPMRLQIGDLGAAADILQGEADSLTFSVSISPSAALDQFSIEIRDTNDVTVTSELSGNKVLVLDKDTQQDFAGKLRSGSLVVLNNRFEEFAHNYPNPFSPANGPTRITYFLESPASVSVKIFDLTGELVYEKNYGVGDPGTGAGAQEVEWDGRNMQGTRVRNGLYVCRIESGSSSATFRIAVAN